MTATDVIREYLVKLGFQVDTSAYQKMHDLLDGLNKKIGKNTSDMGKSYLKYATIAISAIAAIDTALVAQVGKTIKADMEYQKFALHMFTTKEQAKKTKIAMDSLGASIEDIANIPELSEKYRKLMVLMDRLKPKNASEDEAEYKRLRGIAFQFKELSITGKFFADQMVASLSRKLSPELDALSNKLKSMHEFFIKNKDNIVESTTDKLKHMGTVTKAVLGAMGLVATGLLAYKGFGMLKNLGGFAKNLWSGIVGEAKLAKSIAKGKAIEATTGVQPVYVVNAEEIKNENKVVDAAKDAALLTAAAKTAAPVAASGAMTTWALPAIVIASLVAGIGVAINEAFQNLQGEEGFFGKFHRESTKGVAGRPEGLAIGEGEGNTYALMWEGLKSLFTSQAAMAPIMPGGYGGGGGGIPVPYSSPTDDSQTLVTVSINVDPKSGVVTQPQPPKVEKLRVKLKSVGGSK